LELAFDSRWANNLTSRVAYTYLDAHYNEAFLSNLVPVSAGSKLPGIAENNLFAEVAWKHPASGFHAAVEGIARSKVYVEDTNTRQAAPGYAIANLRFGVDRRYGALKLGTFLRLNNLFDRQYVGSVIVGDGNLRFYEAAPGFNWLAGVSARYAF
jgi:iron complex outermembrane receptor protein